MERTCMEIARLERAAAFRRVRISRSRLRVRESDALLDLVEECRQRDWRLVPSQLWSAVARAVREVDPRLRDELGINRDPEHVADILFAAQEVLLMRARRDRAPALAEIIPLFGDRTTGIAAG
jgi:hypothetical protein